jgi:hypothetical protein
MQVRIKRIGFVYNGAQLTVVTAYEDNADSGLSGVSISLVQKANLVRKFAISSSSPLPRNALQALLNYSQYTRDWTPHEIVLCKSLLAFTEDQMLFP